jgi:hypothetical protein
MSTLAALRAKLQAQESRTAANQQAAQSNGDNSIYAFWNLQEGQSSTVRFLPDKDPNNSYFWVERNMIRLPFPGVKGQNENKEVVVQVPCIEMFGENEKCPILAEVRTWYKDNSLKEIADKYWKKRTYIYQGFVRQNGLADDVPPENPIRRFIVKPPIYKCIKGPLLDPDFDIMPTDYDRGLDFKLQATKNGKWIDFVTSNWSRRESALTEVERAAIDNYGLFDLKEFLPKRPSDSELRIMKEMFEASVDGKLYDPDRWAAYFKPWGLQVAGNSARDEVDEDAPRSKVSVPVRNNPVAAQEQEEDTAINSASKSSTPPWEDEPEEPVVANEVKIPSKPASGKAQDILDLIRARQAKAS